MAENTHLLLLMSTNKNVQHSFENLTKLAREILSRMLWQ